MVEPLRIPARGDGYSLSAGLFVPRGPPKAAALIAGAMAVRASFYAPFARYLADQGLAALTLDYRGIGGSRPQGSLRGFHATFHDWGERDLGGALDWLEHRFPGVPLVWVGHSAGAQLMGLVQEPAPGAALFVASGTAYWNSYRGLGRAVMASLWYAALPPLLAAAGFLPMRLFRQGDDVPAGVAHEWMRWGRDPRYVFSYAEPRGGLGYTRYDGPLLALSIEDDWYAPATAVAHLLSLYTRARKEERILRPDAQPIGHFGFFRRSDLWKEPVCWLLAHVAS
ncbi:MAG TPA: alpha/beta fold hydrolase [Myxococcales bacterium]|nr:alpha/beta fold hydrolase [Myxococcales bacterium]